MLPEGISPSNAPPPAVFVAGSIRPAADPVTLPPPAQVTAQPLIGLADIEARLAAARAGSIGLNAPAPPPPPAGGLVPPPPAAQAPAPPAQLPANSPPANAPPAASANAPPAPPPPPPLGRFTFAPPITPSARFSAPAPTPPPAPEGAAPEAPAPAAPATQAPVNLNAFRDPAALVRALSLPVTPTNIAAAKLALDTPQRLPAALATLENALPDADDPRVTTLRTLSAFVGRMEPSSPQLAAQISAYVDNVVTGNEPKLAQLLNAQLANANANAEPETSAAGAPPAQPGAPGAAAAPAPAPPLPVALLAQIVERGAALTVDLKTQLLSVVNAPPAGSEEAGALVPAASSALTAITAVQMNAAQAMNATPQTMAFTLPMWLGSGYAQAHIAIDRDAPEPNGNRSLDGDNFHIAFILDTKNLGTVSVDLQTVGRSFSLAVKTESELSAKRFAGALTKLTSRLETLRYRVNSAEASVAPRGAAPAMPAPLTAVEETVAEETIADGPGTEFNARA